MELLVDVGDIGDGEIEAVVALWERCGLTRPWNDARADIALARASPTSAVLAGRENGEVVATVMVGCDGHRGWVYYLAVEPRLRRGGKGRAMMRAAERWAQALGVPKIQLMVRGENAAAIGFYKALGYLTEDTVVVGKRFDGRTWSTIDG